MRKIYYLAAFLLIISFVTTGCTKKANPVAENNNQQTKTLASLPQVQMKPVDSQDPSTYPPENFITVKTSDGKQIGDAYRTYLANTFMVKLAVSMGNGTYQAFIIRPSDQQFIALGSLTKKQDKWVADFSSDKDGKEFTHLVITSGNNVTDPAKATVVATGDFRN